MKAHPDVHRRAAKAHYERYKPIQRERSRAWNRANPEKRFDTHMRRTYGITAVTYRRMLAEQGGRCAICRELESAVDKRTGKPRRLHVDHDHKTKVVRSLLCTRCNMAVGYLMDDAGRADAVAAYIRSHSSCGTADLVRRARAAGIEVMEVPAPNIDTVPKKEG